MEQKTLHRELGRPLDESGSTFDLRKALADLRAEPAIDKEGRNAIILHKEAGLKVVLVAMKAGNEIKSHSAPGPITVQVVEGALRFHSGKSALRLEEGGLLTLHARVEHDLAALEESAFLLTLAAPRGH